MKPETRLAVLEAFASSKPTEFDGFVIRYLEAHPEAPEPVEEPVVVVPIVPEAVEEEPKPVSKRHKKTVEVVTDE